MAFALIFYLCYYAVGTFNGWVVAKLQDEGRR